MAQANVEILIDLITKQAIENAKQLNSTLQGMTGSLEETATAATQASTGAESFASSVVVMNQALQLVSAVAGFVVDGIKAIADGFISAVKDAAEFEAQMAEIQTLFGSVSIESQKLQKDLLGISSAFGTDRTTTAKAYYQAISSGAVDASTATELLTVANKLAVGGVTNLSTAVDGITNVLNGWNLNVSESAKISDIFFIGMQKGKTTVGELAGELNKAAPNAAALGIQFDELAAASAALTLTGTPTAVTFTQLKAVMANLQKPSEDLTKAFKNAGITSLETSIKTDGLGGVLNKLVKTTDGTATGIAKLFSSVEAGSAVLALTGTQAAAFTDILGTMKEAALNAGQTSEQAFQKVAESVDFQMKRAAQQLSNFGVEIGAAFLPAVSEILSLFNDVAQGAIKFLQDNKDSFLKAGQAVKDFVTDTRELLNAVANSDAFKIAVDLLRVSWEEFASTFRNSLAVIKELWTQTFSVLTQDSETLATVFNTVLAISLNQINTAFKAFALAVELAMKSVRDFVTVSSAVLNFLGLTDDESKKVTKSATAMADAIVASARAASSAKSENQLFSVSLGEVFKKTEDAKGATNSLKKATESIAPAKKEDKQLTDEQKKAIEAYGKRLTELGDELKKLQFYAKNAENVYKLIDADAELAKIALVLGKDKVAQTVLEEQRLSSIKKTKEAGILRAKLVAEYELKAVQDVYAKRIEAEKKAAEESLKLQKANQEQAEKNAETLGTNYRRQWDSFAKSEQEVMKQTQDDIKGLEDAHKKAVDASIKEWQRLAKLFSELGGAFTDSMTGAISGISQMLSGDIFLGIKTSIESTVSGARNAFVALASYASESFARIVGPEFFEKIKAVGGVFGEALSGAAQIWYSAMEAGVAALTTGLQTAFRAVSGGFFADIASGIASVLSDVENTAKTIEESTKTILDFGKKDTDEQNKAIEQKEKDEIASIKARYATEIDAAREANSTISAEKKKEIDAAIKAIKDKEDAEVKAARRAAEEVARSLDAQKRAALAVKDLTSEQRAEITASFAAQKAAQQDALEDRIDAIRTAAENEREATKDKISGIGTEQKAAIKAIEAKRDAEIQAAKDVAAANKENTAKESTAGNIFGDIATSVDDFVNAFVARIPEIVTQFLEAAPRLIESIVSGIPKLVKTFIKELPKILAVIAKGLPDLIKTVADNLPIIVNALVDNLGPIIDGLIKELPRLVENLIDSIIKLSDKFGPMIVKLVSNLIQSIIKKIPDIVRSILQLIPKIIAEIPKIIAAIVKMLPDLITVILQELPKIILAIIDAIPDIIVAVIEAIPSIIQAIIANLPNFINSLVIGIIERLPEIALKLIEALINLVPNLIASIWNGMGESFDFESFGADIWNGLKSFGDTIGQWFKGLGGSIWEGLKSFGETIWSFFKEVGTKIWDGLASTVEQVWLWFKEVGKQIFQGLKDIVNEVWLWFQDVGKQIWEGIVSIAEKIWAWFRDLGAKIWEGLAAFFETAWEKFKGFGSAIWDGLKSAIEGVGNFFYDIGKKIWDGLKSGLDSIGDFFSSGSGGDFLSELDPTSKNSTVGKFMPWNRAEGGIIPGRAAVAGDSYRNDTVPALLSPGEMVIPRSAMDGGFGEIMRFVAQELGAQRLAYGGLVGSMPRGMSTTSGGSDFVVEIQQMRAEMKEMGFQIAKNSMQQLRIIQRWDVDGLPEERTV